MTPTSDRLINYTETRVKNNILTYGFRKGEIIPTFRKAIKKTIRGIDQKIDLDFKFTKNKGKADIIIGHGVIPEGATAAAVWTDTRWEIRLPLRLYGDYIFKHEIGHVLGFEHVDIGTKSLMAPGWNGYSDFSKADLKALRNIWGS